MQLDENTTLSKNLSTTLKDSLHSTQSISGRASILTYANKQYPSATDALQAYINDFDNKQSSTPYKRTVEDLLSPKSVLLQTVERSLATGVRDTRAETQRHRIKKLTDESYYEIQRADLEQDRAKELIEASTQLHRISSSDLSGLTPDKTLQPQHSLTSLSTDTLVFQASQSGFTYKFDVESDTKVNPRLSVSENATHLSPLQESYKANAIQLKSLQANVGSGRSSGILKKLPSPERKRGYREVSFTGSTNVQDGSFEHKNTGTMTTAAPQSAEYKTTAIDRFSNEKASFGRNPTKHRFTDESILSGGRMAPSWVEDLDMTEFSTNVPQSKKPVQKTVITSKLSNDNRKSNASEISGYRSIPSWIQDISVSEIQDTGESRSHIGRAPPSWINHLNGSEISSVIPTARHVPLNDQNNLSRSGKYTAKLHSTRGAGFLTPGLTYQDLNSSNTSPNKENNSDCYGNTGRTRIKSSAEINRLVRNSKTGRVRTFPTSSPVTTRRLSSDMVSMTTDDLILEPSTGRGLPASRSMEDLKITLEQMERSPRRSSGRGTARSKRTMSQNSQRSTSPSLKGHGAWQRHLSQKPAPMKGNDDRTRLNISDLYSTPSKYASHRHEQDLKPTHSCDPPKSCWKRDDYVITSQGHSKYSRWTSDAPHTGRFTNPRGSSEEYEQRVIDRAEKILGSPLTRPLHNLQTQSPNTEDILDGDRSWEKAVPPYKPLRPVYGRNESRRTHIIDRFLDDCLNSSSTSPCLTTGEQPGPVEALKNMLFTIQSVAIANDLTEDDEKVPEKDDTIQDVVAPKVDGSKQIDLLTSDAESQSEGTIDDEEEGSKSLKRAMEHLSRLKYLVRSDSEQTLSQDTRHGITE